MPASPTDELENQGSVTNDLANLNDGAEAQGQTPDDSNLADTSTAKDAEKPTMSDAVRTALAGGHEKSSLSSDDKAKPGQTADAAKKADQQDDLGDVTEEELNSYHPKTQRRVKQLLGRAKAAEEQYSAAKPVVERMARIDNFVKQNNLSETEMNAMYTAAAQVKTAGLSSEEFMSGVKIMEVMRNDPARAFELLSPIYRQLEAIVGVQLPPDLAQQVQEGKVTQEVAQELSRSRADRAIAAARQTESANREEESQIQSQRAALGDSVATAVTNFENNWKSRDADYHLKSTLWNEKMQLRMGKGWLPASAEEAIKVADECKKEVDEYLKKLRPTRQAITPPPSDVGTSTGSKPAPATFLDAVKGALRA